MPTKYLTENEFRANNHVRNMRALSDALNNLLGVSRSVRAQLQDDGNSSDTSATPVSVVVKQSEELGRFARAVACNAMDIAWMADEAAADELAEQFHNGEYERRLP